MPDKSECVVTAAKDVADVIATIKWANVNHKLG
jgi:hypothetical protein